MHLLAAFQKPVTLTRGCDLVIVVPSAQFDNYDKSDIEWCDITWSYSKAEKLDDLTTITFRRVFS